MQESAKYIVEHATFSAILRKSITYTRGDSMDNVAFGNIFADSYTRRSITIGTGAMVSTIQIPRTAKATNLFRFEELKNGFAQALRQVKAGAQALVLVIHYDPAVSHFADPATTGWRNLDGQLLGHTFSRVELSPYKDTELHFDEQAKMVIASTLRVKAETNKGPREIGIGLGVAITCDGLICPKPDLSE
jgi:hypothetical protein